VPDYFYRALNGGGTIEEGWVNAASEHDVAEQLRGRGAYLISAVVRDRPKRVTDGTIDRRELLAFLEYLAGSFTAGIPLLTTLNDIPKRVRSPRLKVVVSEVAASVSEKGMSLSEAMAQHPRAFPHLFIATIQAGEASGQLAFALEQLVEYLDWQENIASQVRQATMYPIVVLSAIALLVVGLLGFVFPRLIPVLRMRQVELPLPTRIIMSVSLFIQLHWALLLFVGVALVAGVMFARRRPRGRLWLDRALLKVPALGQFLLEVDMARVVTYLSLFYRSGVDLLQSLTLVEQMTGNRVVGQVVADARTRIANGATMAAAFGESPLVPVIVMRSLALGESTGRLDEALERAKVYYGREIPAAVRRVITLIQPIMIALLGGVILLVALAIMLPILNIYNSIGVRR
jgi:type II secretory pathway component PulF